MSGILARWSRRRLLVAGAGGSMVAIAGESTSTSDIVFRSAGTTKLAATFYRPAGRGPFPLVVSVHGGAWTMSDRGGVAAVARYLADNGIGVLAVDFRMPPVAAYPASIADIHYAVRWAKANADQLDTQPDCIGLIGESSGAHQAVLLAMRPTDPRYASIAMPDHPALDASVRYVVSCWGIVDPFARYRMAVEKDITPLLAAHRAYWGDEAAMSEGSPQRILERNETVQLPALLLLQGTADQNIDWRIAEKFAGIWRQRGGSVDLRLYEGAVHGFIRAPYDADSQDALARIRDFIRRMTS